MLLSMRIGLARSGLAAALSFASIAWTGDLAAEEWGTAWSLTLSAESTRGYEYGGSCADPMSGRLHVLLAPDSSRSSGPRNVLVARVSKEGRLEGVVPLGDARLEDPLTSASFCAVLDDGAFVVVGSTRARSLVAVTDRSGEWSTVSLGPGGYEAKVYDMAPLTDRRFALVGSYKLKGFVVTFDPSAGSANRVEWSGRQAGSLVLDVEPSPDGQVICGFEGPREEVFSSASEWFVASFDRQGVEKARTYRPGFSCRLLTSRLASDEVEAIYAVVDPRAELRRMTFTAKLDSVKDDLVLERVAFMVFLDSAEVRDVFATLSRSPGSEIVEIFSRASGQRIASRRLGYQAFKGSDLIAANDAFVVVGRALEEGATQPLVRLDAFAP